MRLLQFGRIVGTTLGCGTRVHWQRSIQQVSILLFRTTRLATLKEVVQVYSDLGSMGIVLFDRCRYCDMLATLWGSLVSGGVVILKENCCQDETFSVDVDDASVTQSLAYWQDLIY